MSNCSTSDAPLAERSNKSLHKMCVFRGNISEMKTLHRMHSKLVRCQFIEETLKVVAPVYKYTNTNTQIQIHKYTKLKLVICQFRNFESCCAAVYWKLSNSIHRILKGIWIGWNTLLQFDFEAIIYTIHFYTIFFVKIKH